MSYSCMDVADYGFVNIEKPLPYLKNGKFRFRLHLGNAGVVESA